MGTTGERLLRRRCLRPFAAGGPSRSRCCHLQASDHARDADIIDQLIDRAPNAADTVSPEGKERVSMVRASGLSSMRTVHGVGQCVAHKLNKFCFPTFQLLLDGWCPSTTE